MTKERKIETLEQLIEAISSDTKNWTHSGFAKPWFRGHTNYCYKLLPSVLRAGNEVHEFNITNKFRLVSPGFGKVPERSRIDQWLFLMQHLELPTRLLDWSENPLAAAFFATSKVMESETISNDAAIFAIDPIALNKASGFDYFPNTWAQNSVLQTIKFAFGTQDEEVDGEAIKYLEKPIAIYPSTIHSRISSQKGCFTLHGNDKRDIQSIFTKDELITKSYLVKYKIEKNFVRQLFEQINKCGITYSSLFPDLDGLAKELKYSFGIRKG